MNVVIVSDSIRNCETLRKNKSNRKRNKFHPRKLIFWGYAVSIYDLIAPWKLHCYHGNYNSCYYYQLQFLNSTGNGNETWCQLMSRKNQMWFPKMVDYFT